MLCCVKIEQLGAPSPVGRLKILSPSSKLPFRTHRTHPPTLDMAYRSQTARAHRHKLTHTHTPMQLVQQIKAWHEKIWSTEQHSSYDRLHLMINGPVLSGFNSQNAYEVQSVDLQPLLFVINTLLYDGRLPPVTTRWSAPWELQQKGTRGKTLGSISGGITILIDPALAIGRGLANPLHYILGTFLHETMHVAFRLLGCNGRCGIAECLATRTESLGESGHGDAFLLLAFYLEPYVNWLMDAHMDLGSVRGLKTEYATSGRLPTPLMVSILWPGQRIELVEGTVDGKRTAWEVMTGVKARKVMVPRLVNV